jgi:hypothetical protein
MRRWIACTAAILVLLTTPVAADLASRYTVRGKSSDGTEYAGVMTFAPAGQIYRMNYCCDKFTGLAIEYQDFLAIVAMGAESGGVLDLYRRIDNGWAGVVSTYADEPLGAEIIYNGDVSALPNVNPGKAGKLASKFRIAGTNPNGSTYSGAIELTARSKSSTFDVDRTVGGSEATGTAVTLDGAIVINVSTDLDAAREKIDLVGLFVPEGNGFLGVWVKAGSQQLGAERWVHE